MTECDKGPGRVACDLSRLSAKKQDIRIVKKTDRLHKKVSVRC